MTITDDTRLAGLLPARCKGCGCRVFLRFFPQTGWYERWWLSPVRWSWRSHDGRCKGE